MMVSASACDAQVLPSDERPRPKQILPEMKHLQMNSIRPVRNHLSQRGPMGRLVLV